MAWSSDFSPDAVRDIETFTKQVRLQILERVACLTEHFDSINPLPLHGEWRGFYKLRVNDYRVMYKIKYEERVIRVEYIDHRSKAYKKRK